MAKSTFSSLSTSVSGLFAAQRSLDVISHNISNMNTKGYTRQRAEQKTAGATFQDRKYYLGCGVKMEEIRQIRDQLLDIKYRNEASKKGYWEELHVSLTQIENIFNEPNGTGISKVLDEFYTSIDTVAQHSNDPTAKANFIATSLALTRYTSNTLLKFEKLISDANEEVEATVNDLNSTLKEIAALNKEIFYAESNGAMANDLRDKRNLLIDHLSEMADVRINKSYVENNIGGKIEKLQIEIGDKVVVNHSNAYEIRMIKESDHPLYTVSKENNNPPSEDLKNVKITKLCFDDHSDVNMNKIGGKLGGILRQRDSFGDPSMGHEVRGIPYYVRVLNEFTKAFANELNYYHKQGVDQNGDKGEDLFVTNDHSSTIDARNITVNPDIVNSIKKLAIGVSKDESDNKNFLALYNTRNNPIELKINQYVAGNFKELVLAKGEPEDVIKSLISSTLGVDAMEAKSSYDTENILVIEADMRRMEVSSVSENEELVNMIKFQHAYSASARMINTIDEMIDILINRMGRVGL